MSSSHQNIQKKLEGAKTNPAFQNAVETQTKWEQSQEADIALWKRAVEQYIQIIKQDSSNGDVYYRLGMLAADKRIKNSKKAIALGKLNNPIELFLKAKELGNVDASFQLGVMYLYDKKYLDIELGKVYLKDAADKIHPLALVEYTYYLSNCIGHEKNIEQVMEYNLRLIEAKEYAPSGFSPKLFPHLVANSKLKLAEYYHMNGNLKQKEKAILWLRELDKQGDNEASYFYAHILIAKGGEREDKAEADKLIQNGLTKLESLVSSNYILAELALGNLYLGQFGVEQNLFLAEYYLQRAAHRGYFQALYQLCHIHKNRHDMEQYFELLELAAKKGYGNAKFEYGYCLYLGVNLPAHIEKDEKKGLTYITAAAKGGCKEAKKYLVSIQMKKADETSDLYKSLKMNASAFNNLIDIVSEEHQHPLAGLFSIWKNKEHTEKNPQIIIKNILEFVKDNSSGALSVQIEENKNSEASSLDVPPSLAVKKKKSSPKKGLNFPSRISKNGVYKQIDYASINSQGSEEVVYQNNSEGKEHVQSSSVSINERNKNQRHKRKSRILKSKTQNNNNLRVESLSEESEGEVQSSDLDKTRILLPEKISTFLKRLNEKGFHAYIVGGYVRNQLLGEEKKYSDFDIVTNATDEILAEELQWVKSTYEENLSYLKIDKLKIDIWRNPELTDMFEYDYPGRDFTINALYADANGIVYDPSKRGLKDLADKKLQSITFYHQNFLNNPSCLLRYTYFLSLGFEGHYHQNLIRDHYLHKLNDLSQGKLFALFCKHFMTGRGEYALTILNKFGITEFLFPEFKILDVDIMAWVKNELRKTDVKFAEGRFLSKMHLLCVFTAASIHLTDIRQFNQIDTQAYVRKLNNKFTDEEINQYTQLTNSLLVNKLAFTQIQDQKPADLAKYPLPKIDQGYQQFGQFKPLFGEPDAAATIQPSNLSKISF